MIVRSRSHEISDEEEIGAYVGENNSSIPVIEISKSISKGFSRISLSVIKSSSATASVPFNRGLYERRSIK